MIYNNSDESNHACSAKTHHYSFIHSFNPYLLTVLVLDIITYYLYIIFPKIILRVFETIVDALYNVVELSWYAG